MHGSAGPARGHTPAIAFVWTRHQSSYEPRLLLWTTSGSAQAGSRLPARLARQAAWSRRPFVVVIPSDCSRGLWVVLGHGKEDAKAQRHSGAARPGHPPAGPRRQARRRNHWAGRGLHGRLSERGRRGREGPSTPPATLAARALSPVWKAKAEPTTDTLSLLAHSDSRTRPLAECSFHGDPTLWWQWRAGFGRRPRRKPMI